jgi:hypothetical protein
MKQVGDKAGSSDPPLPPAPTGPPAPVEGSGSGTVSFENSEEFSEDLMREVISRLHWERKTVGRLFVRSIGNLNHVRTNRELFKFRKE